VSSRRPEIVAADANVLLAALALKAAARILTAPELRVVTAERNMIEIEAHLPDFAERYDLSPEALHEAVAALPVEVHAEADYASHLPEARRLLAQSDSGDVHLLALALTLEVPIWSNDNDFTHDLPVEVYRTAELIKLLGV
jgi:predicted nucleic acid-binding protein